MTRTKSNGLRLLLVEYISTTLSWLVLTDILKQHDRGAISREHSDYLLARHGTAELDPLPSMNDADPLNWPKAKASPLSRYTYTLIMRTDSAVIVEDIRARDGSFSGHDEYVHRSKYSERFRTDQHRLWRLFTNSILPCLVIHRSPRRSSVLLVSNRRSLGSPPGVSGIHGHHGSWQHRLRSFTELQLHGWLSSSHCILRFSSCCHRDRSCRRHVFQERERSIHWSLDCYDHSGSSGGAIHIRLRSSESQLQVDLLDFSNCKPTI